MNTIAKIGMVALLGAFASTCAFFWSQFGDAVYAAYLINGIVCL